MNCPRLQISKLWNSYLFNKNEFIKNIYLFVFSLFILSTRVVLIAYLTVNSSSCLGLGKNLKCESERYGFYLNRSHKHLFL